MVQACNGYDGNNWALAAINFPDPVAPATGLSG